MRQVTSGRTNPQLPQPVAGGAPQAPVAQQTVAAPLSATDVVGLRARRDELSQQLGSAVGRRNSLASQIQKADGASRAGLEQRMTLLDQRILGLERDIDANGRQLASMPGELLTSTQAPWEGGMLSSSQVTGISIVGILFVLAPLAIGSVLLRLRRASAAGPPPLPVEVERRMERIELAVDTIAVEVERISEGQRFVTQLLNRTAESLPAIGAGERAAPAAPAEPPRTRAAD